MVGEIGCLPTSTGTRAGRQCVEGPEGEENHAKASTACHPWWRGARHPDQGDHRRRRRHPPHPQVAHRQEGRGHPASPVGRLSSAKLTQSWHFDPLCQVLTKCSELAKKVKKSKLFCNACQASKRYTIYIDANQRWLPPQNTFQTFPLKSLNLLPSDPNFYDTIATIFHGGGDSCFCIVLYQTVDIVIAFRNKPISIYISFSSFFVAGCLLIWNLL